MPNIERDWTSSNYAFIDPDTIQITGGSGTVTVHGDGTIDIVNNGSTEFQFTTEDLYFEEGSYWAKWSSQYATLTVNSQATNNLSLLRVNFSDDMYSSAYAVWSSGTYATTQYSQRTKMPDMVKCNITIGVKPHSSITGMELGLVKGNYPSAWESAYKPFSENGWLFVRFIYQNEDGTWPGFTEPYETKSYTLPAGVNPIPEEAFVPNPAKAPSTGEYVLDEGQSDTGTVTITAGATRNAVIYFKLNFTVTYHDATGTNADVTTDSLDYGATTPTAPSFTGTPSREGYSFAGWIPRVSATVQGDVTYTATWRDRPRPILTIGGKALSDFGECVASRNTGAPEKKTSTVTVPHMSGFWDFSKIYGALAYESREVTYTIQLLGDDRADLQDRKSALMTWLLATHDQAIYDDDIKGWHFVGSCQSCDWKEGDEGESGTITATLLCQPFLYADEATTASVPEGAQVVSNPGEAVNPMAAAASGTATVTLGGVTQSVTTTPTRLVGQLVPGDNNVTVSGGTVTLTWYETRI